MPLQTDTDAHTSSSTKFTESSNNSVDGVGGVVEGRNVAGTPRELRAHSCEHTVFVVVFRSKVSNFLLSCRKLLSTRHKSDHFKQTHLLEVADVAHSLELIKVASVVNEVKHEVILHSHVKCLQLLSACTTSADSSINCVL